MFKKDLEDLKATVDALTHQQNNASSIFKEDLQDLKAACVSNSGTLNVSSLICEYRARLNAFVTAVVA